MKRTFHDQSTQIVDADEAEQQMGRTGEPNTVLAMLSNDPVKAPSRNPRNRSENSNLFRLHLGKQKKRKRAVKAVIITAAVIFGIAVLATTGYFARRIYYIKQPNNTLGNGSAQVAFKKAKYFNAKINVAGFTAPLKTRFAAVTTTNQLKPLMETDKRPNRKLVAPMGKKKRGKYRRGKRKGGKKLVTQTGTKKKKKKKKMSGKDLNRLLKDTGF